MNNVTLFFISVADDFQFCHEHSSIILPFAEVTANK